MGKNSPRNPLWPDWFDGEKIDEVTFCHELIRNHPMKCIENRFFTPDGPVEDEAELKQLILKEIQAFIIHGLSKKVSNLLESLRIIAYSAPLDIEVDCIHLKNGIYHLANGTFQESRMFCRNRLPVAYNPKAAKPERWLAFLNELLEPEDIPTLQEYLGYCLIPCTKGQKMMFLIGQGGEGKSRIGIVLREIFMDNMLTGNVHRIENDRFFRYNLKDRLLMVDDDMQMQALSSTGYIKNLVTAETPIDVEAKGKQSEQALLYTRLLCFGNGSPKTLYDKSKGFSRRMIILTTLPPPEKRIIDPYIAKKFIAEKEKIFCWMYDGLLRLLANNYRFTISDRARQNVMETMQDNCNITEFLEDTDRVQYGENLRVASSVLYDSYYHWCEDNALTALKRETFVSWLRQNEVAYHIKYDLNIPSGSSHVRGFKGIALKFKSSAY